MFPISLLPGAISELVAAVQDTHYITTADLYGLMAAVLDGSLGEEDRFCIDLLLRSVCRGRIQIVDELSIVM